MTIENSNSNDEVEIRTIIEERVKAVGDKNTDTLLSNMRSAAQALGVNHSTISRILEKFNRTYNQKPFHTCRKRANAHSAIAAVAA